MNELIFILYSLSLSGAILVALYLGKEALISLISVLAILVNLFVIKEIKLFGLTATASDAIAISIPLGLNLLQEYWGKETARKTIWLSFFCAIFYNLIGQLHLAYAPASTDIAHNHFIALLAPMPRIIISSLIVYLIVQNLELKLYGYFSKKFHNKHFILRNYSSVAITQFIDTVLFSFLGLYNINQSFSDINTILQIIVVSYFIKLIAIALETPFLALSKKLLNKNY